MKRISDSNLRMLKTWMLHSLKKKWYIYICFTYHNWGMSCQKQISRAGASNYIPQILWDVITWYLFLAQHCSIIPCSYSMTCRGLVTDVSVNRSSLVQVITCGLFGTKPWPVSVMNFCQSVEHLEGTSIRFESKKAFLKMHLEMILSNELKRWRTCLSSYKVS